MEPWREELYHHGIKGQKHGVNRYQTTDGTWTEEGLRRRREREGFGEGNNVAKVASDKLRSIKSNVSKSIKKRRAAAQKKKQERAKVREEKEQANQAKIDEKARIAEEKRIKSREDALKRGSAADILKYQGEYTNEELKTAIDRLNNEETLRKIKNKDVKTGMDYVNGAINVMKTASNLIGAGADIVKKVNELTDALDNGKSDKKEPYRARYAQSQAKAFVDGLKNGTYTMDQVDKQQQKLQKLIDIEKLADTGSLKGNGGDNKN